tara:strand:+ start:243 stop:416 length:174 start_codon:yes stop_codon:yes gene_type:complete
MNAPRASMFFIGAGMHVLAGHFYVKNVSNLLKGNIQTTYMVEHGKLENKKNLKINNF